MPRKLTGFVGFPDTKMKPVIIPDLFFTDLLPQIDDLVELKLTLHCFWLLNSQEGDLRYVRGDDKFCFVVCNPICAANKPDSGVL